MSDKVAQLSAIFQPDTASSWIANMWDRFNNQRANKLDEWLELQKYIFATDTTTTSNSTLPWKNNTTLPKLCQLSDNLHANYMGALFPNDRWLTWQAYTEDSAQHDVATTITAYMDNKLRESQFRTIASQLVYDYIWYGNAFVMPSFERRYFDYNGEKVADYVGPKSVRISPYDIVFDATGSDFSRVPKIVRSIKTIGELKKLAITQPGQEFWDDVVQRRQEIRHLSTGLSKDDWEKVTQYSIDGFGNLYDYYAGDYVEVLEFYGDWYNPDNQELETNRMITIVDRAMIVRNAPVSTYSGETPIRHVAWRQRPDNLWGMGPLDNLVGLQYRLDHLENLKADAMDLLVHPPLKIMGEVEKFVWGPGAEIHMDENSDIQEVAKNIGNVVSAQSEMQAIEDRMELYAGAPREAMGIRSPGEKTAFEVDKLTTAASRIFQEKATNFEIGLLEPHLNDLLEISHMNFDGIEHISLTDNDIGAQEFREITKDDITAAGVLRPVGARHFAQQAQDLVNLNQLFNGPLGNMVAPHTSGIELSRMISQVMNLRGYSVFRPNVAVMEQADSGRLMQQAQSDLQNEAAMASPHEDMRDLGITGEEDQTESEPQ